jgi:hypothetical protein
MAYASETNYNLSFTNFWKRKGDFGLTKILTVRICFGLDFWVGFLGQLDYEKKWI